MILGVDTGLATFGWALLDEQTLECKRLGVVKADKTHVAARHVDRALRLLPQGDVLVEAIRECNTVAVEECSFGGGGINSAVPVSLSFGQVVGIVLSQNPRPRMVSIGPKKWQRLVTGSNARKMNYDDVAARAMKHLTTTSPGAIAELEQIPKGLRNHALDAALIAYVAAMWPEQCDEIVPRETTTKKRSRELVVLGKNGYPDYMLERARRAVLTLGDFPGFTPVPGVPATRESCVDGPRPCPHVRCRHHLWLLLEGDRAGNPNRKAGTTLLPQSCDTCSLDLADRGGMSSEAVGEALGLDYSRVKGLVKSATDKLRADGVAMEMLGKP